MLPRKEPPLVRPTPCWIPRPTLPALMKMGVLRVVYPQRVIRHLRRMFAIRFIMLRNKLRRRM